MHEHEAYDPDVLCALASVTSEDDVLLSEVLAPYTTFKIGGAADALVVPRSVEALVKALNICAIAGLPVTVLGNGSNVLVSDRGVRGVVVLLRDNLAAIEVDVAHRRVTAEAGALLRDVALAAAGAGLSGLEPLWGIPASVGGACYMNAGAYGAAVADVLESVEVYVPGRDLADGTRDKGLVRTLSVGELHMGYRKSRVRDEGLTVLRATFSLEPGNAAVIRSDMAEYQRKREEKQPLDTPSAGSTFKRPEGHFAGQLIQEAGLAGRQVGGAQVSTKHCGFVVNVGGAHARDVLALIEQVQAAVLESSGVRLEPEVRLIGEF